MLRFLEILMVLAQVVEQLVPLERVVREEAGPAAFSKKVLLCRRSEGKSSDRQSGKYALEPL